MVDGEYYDLIMIKIIVSVFCVSGLLQASEAVFSQFGQCNQLSRQNFIDANGVSVN